MKTMELLNFGHKLLTNNSKVIWSYYLILDTKSPKIGSAVFKVTTLPIVPYKSDVKRLIVLHLIDTLQSITLLYS